MGTQPRWSWHEFRSWRCWLLSMFEQGNRTEKINPIFYHSYSLNVLIVRPENRKIELKDKVVFLAMLNCYALESVEIVVSTCQSYILNWMRSQQWPYLVLHLLRFIEPSIEQSIREFFLEQQLVYLLVEIPLGKNNLTSKSNLSFEWLQCSILTLTFDYEQQHYLHFSFSVVFGSFSAVLRQHKPGKLLQSLIDSIRSLRVFSGSVCMYVEYICLAASHRKVVVLSTVSLYVS